jgi:hypothetical protein
MPAASSASTSSSRAVTGSTAGARRSSAYRSNPVGRHREWAADIEQTQGAAPNYPVIGDADFHVSKLSSRHPAVKLTWQKA